MNSVADSDPGGAGGMSAGGSGALEGGVGLSLEYGGESLLLLGGHGVWWPAQQTLLIADVHLGKEATFRSSAIPVPDQTSAMLQRLSQMISGTGSRRLIILGDLIHARRGRCAETWRQVAEWRATNVADLEVILVRGNHDLAAGDPPADWQIGCVADPFRVAPFCLAHIPPAGDAGDESAVIAGHLHPVVRLSGPARDTLRLPCFLLRRNLFVLPAFSRFVDGRVFVAEQGDRVFGLVEERVVEISTRAAVRRSSRGIR